jgi:hypothetical protein
MIIKMSDRLTVDHINNTISIQVSSRDLSQMTSEEIIEWAHQFLSTLKTTHFIDGSVGEKID